MCQGSNCSRSDKDSCGCGASDEDLVRIQDAEAAMEADLIRIHTEGDAYRQNKAQQRAAAKVRLRETEKARLIDEALFVAIERGELNRCLELSADVELLNQRNRVLTCWGLDVAATML